MAFLRRSATTAVLFALHLLLVTASVASSPSSLPEQQQDDMPALLHLKRALTSGAGDALRQWSPESGAHHCSWPGVTCDARSGRVVALALGGRLGGELSPAVARLTELKALSFPSAGLRGEIPPHLWRLRRLQVLNLAGNSLRGRLPATFPEGLKSLDLSGNRLSGSIPPALGSCAALRRLRLSSNSLDGTIPPRIGELARLRVLDLSRNRLTGGVPPELLHCTGLVRMDLSGNLLHGRLPSGLVELKSLKFLSLSGNNFSGEVPVDLRNNKLSEEETTAAAVNAVDAVSPVHVVTAHSVTGELLPVSPIPTIIRQLTEIRLGTSNGSTSSSGSNGQGKSRFSPMLKLEPPLTYEAVVHATGNFNASNCIGNGGFGPTYRAEVAPGVLVAIKKLAIGKQHGDKEFQAEVRILGQCRHPHLVTLLGYNISESEMFLIYNYLPGGNLERFIQERGKRPISWRRLHKIALDVARALAYMHDECVPRILHRDVKPNNILLDNECNAYLSDFGLASYGVVLLELISDKKALDPSFSPYGNGFNIVSWAVRLIQRGRVREFFIEGLWEKAPHDDLVEFLNLAVRCTQESLASRPTMKHVVRRLRELRPPSY
ncbi:unnamed protein product [Miscanthus lutarioriparius]|uniref:non-specific serine/threonine protein kinase n=1 Tax=Miscanthus lutarioriparius TaxID=422564 RepID=A0A811ND41_9POAL|nr:unnamed protein product [Miscanthus lutarioriparius]